MAFKKGQSGNPKGRPRGISDKRTVLRELLAPHAEVLIRKAVAMAKAGDTTALRLCLERLIAPMKAKDELVDLEQPGSHFTDRSHAIMTAGLKGLITPGQTSTLMQALAAQVRVHEAQELTERVEVLERKLEGKR